MKAAAALRYMTIRDRRWEYLWFGTRMFFRWHLFFSSRDDQHSHDASLDRGVSSAVRNTGAEVDAFLNAALS